ncbi:uncharacterized protein LOC114579177 isoform X2 [Dendrobium catenatum]|uniref:uncharacterized protein LOC114579177 isoform X2 n=1 Tax=Dendrobium catenatum TaxID=906689 RepID=UPI0010A04882|nr:uncharacterized protein LOC114579177 isoform X2 [Dendrobium catenatum]
MPLILEAFSPLAVIFPVAVDFLAFNILSTMELPITTAPLLPPLFSFRFSSSISGRRVLVALGDRLSSADGIAGTPGLDLVADVDRPGATEVIKFGGASVGKSGWVAGKRERANGETVRLLGLNSGFCFGGSNSVDTDSRRFMFFSLSRLKSSRKRASSSSRSFFALVGGKNLMRPALILASSNRNEVLMEKGSKIDMKKRKK